MADVTDADGPLAEFAALRAEILQLNQQQNPVLALQLTIAGAVFGITVSHPRLIGLLIIVPVVSYSLCMRYLTNGMSIREIARYIREDLSSRVPGGLNWESWIVSNSRENTTYSLVLPLLFTFPGTSALALSWVLTYIFNQSNPKLIGFAVLWSLSCLAAVQQVILIIRLRRDRWPSRTSKS
jgi:hypothetical protein